MTIQHTAGCCSCATGAHLCHDCHNEPPNGVHHNKQVMDILREYGQLKAMREQNWTQEDFMRVFHANYI